MKTVNKFTMSFPSKSSNEAFARAAVASFVLQLDPTLDELSDIKTAVSEAVTNCIVHGYRDVTHMCATGTFLGWPGNPSTMEG